MRNCNCLLVILHEVCNLFECKNVAIFVSADDFFT
jgi:hypothetical protein